MKIKTSPILSSITITVLIFGITGYGCGAPAPITNNPATNEPTPTEYNGPIPSGNTDTDGDSLSDLQEYVLRTDMYKIDSNEDGFNDYQQIFVQNDVPPISALRLALTITDQDGDLLSDTDEENYGTDKNNPDADGDRLIDGLEILYNTDPNNPDTDIDGLTDIREIWWACNPNSPDTDLDTFIDVNEIDLPVGNPNKGDGIPYTKDRLNDVDTEADGLPTGAESWELGLDPMSKSTDGDRYSDGMELLHHDFYTGEDLMGFVPPDPFTPATPDIIIDIDPQVVLVLARSVKIGEKVIESGEITFESQKYNERKVTDSVGAETSLEITASSNPVKNEVSVKTKAWVRVEFQTTSGASAKETEKLGKSKDAYRISETSLSDSQFKITLYIRNIGNDILQSSVNEILLNTYIGTDTSPFNSLPLSISLSNLLPGDFVPYTVYLKPTDYEVIKRYLAGEGIEVRVAHYAFGDDQIWLENARSRSIQLDLSYDNKIERYYVSPKFSNLGSVLNQLGIPFEFSQNGMINQIYYRSSKTPEITGTSPFSWWTLYIKFKDPNKNNQDPEYYTDIAGIPLEAGDYVLFKFDTDTDGDLLTDSQEIRLGTRIDKIDTDEDGLLDGSNVGKLLGELEYGTNPLLPDTDFDTYNDKNEIDAGTDPLDPSSHPSSPSDTQFSTPIPGCPHPGNICCETDLRTGQCSFCIDPSIHQSCP